MRDHANDQAANQVEEHNQNARNCVAPNKLRGAVHRAKEVCLLGYLGPPLLGFVLLNEAGIEVGVDGHLLSGHGI